MDCSFNGGTRTFPTKAMVTAVKKKLQGNWYSTEEENLYEEWRVYNKQGQLLQQQNQEAQVHFKKNGSW